MKRNVTCLMVLLLTLGCETEKKEMVTVETTEIATFGNGCFWCTEAVFEQLRGVSDVKSGFSGGHVVNPTYEQICGKKTGHAEVCQITFDPTVITFDELLEVFWKTHDPTTLNSQGNDHGPQYRSAIFYHSDTQRLLAEGYLKRLDASGAFTAPIVTEITAFKNIYFADESHQNYFRLNQARNPYCQAVIVPKLAKFRKVFAEKLK